MSTVSTRCHPLRAVIRQNTGLLRVPDRTAVGSTVQSRARPDGFTRATRRRLTVADMGVQIPGPGVPIRSLLLVEPGSVA